MKFLLLSLLLLSFISCGDKPTTGETTGTSYRCEQMTEANKVSGCKLGDWWNFDLQRCNSTEANCQK